MSHLIGSAEYWYSGEPEDCDGFQKYMSKTVAFNQAVKHVNSSHYKLTDENVRVARCMFFHVPKPKSSLTSTKLRSKFGL